MEDKIEGRNPVLEALKAGREVEKLLVQKGEREGSILKIISLAKDKKIAVLEVERQKLNALSETGAHQGVMAFVAMHEYASVEDILKRASEKDEPPFIIILDKITDPHNLGAIIRSANSAGAHGIIIPKRNASGLTAVVAKSSAGSLEYTPVARVSNLTQTINELKEKGLWIAGADMTGQDLYKADLKGPIALVIGSEGEGLDRLVKENCDFLIKIPQKGEIESLNASAAAAIIMYEVVRQREM